MQEAANSYPFNCAVCGKGYFTSNPYLTHFRKVHPWLYEQEKAKLSDGKSPKSGSETDTGGKGKSAEDVKTKKEKEDAGIKSKSEDLPKKDIEKRKISEKKKVEESEEE